MITEWVAPGNESVEKLKIDSVVFERVENDKYQKEENIPPKEFF